MNRIEYQVREQHRIAPRSVTVSDKELAETIKKLLARRQTGDVVGKPVIVEIE